MKFMGVSIIICGAISLFGALCPLGITSDFSRSISVAQYSGPACFLYFLPLALIALGILLLMGKLRSYRAWLTPIGVFGLFFSWLLASGATMKLEEMGFRKEDVNFGVGFYLAFVSYLWVTITPWILAYFQSKKNRIT